MPVIPWVPGLPGFRSAVTATPRLIWRQGIQTVFAGGTIIQGSQSRDPGNTGNINRLRSGLLMGKITAATFGTVGLYAPAITGITTGAYTSGGTSLTVSAAQALELERLVGQSGTSELVAIGPPTSAGTVAVTTITHSAINTTTGVLTVSSLGVDKIAGTFIAVNDGRYTPITMIGTDFPVAVTDSDGTSINVPFAQMPIAGCPLVDSLLPAWPTDTSLQTWIMAALSTTSGGKFIFDVGYLP